jgi:hypothetical protein
VHEGIWKIVKRCWNTNGLTKNRSLGCTLTEGPVTSCADDSVHHYTCTRSNMNRQWEFFLKKTLDDFIEEILLDLITQIWYPDLCNNVFEYPRELFTLNFLEREHFLWIVCIAVRGVHGGYYWHHGFFTSCAIEDSSKLKIPTNETADVELLHDNEHWPIRTHQFPNWCVLIGQYCLVAVTCSWFGIRQCINLIGVIEDIWDNGSKNTSTQRAEQTKGIVCHL